MPREARSSLDSEGFSKHSLGTDRNSQQNASTETVLGWVERSCRGQGRPVKITDGAVVSTVAVLLRQTRQTASTRSGSKRVRPRTAGPTTARSRTAATAARFRSSGSASQTARSESERPT
jgi:hypothetical protein